MCSLQHVGGPAATARTAPTNTPSSPRRDKESRQPLKLIARSPLHDTAVETDMMKHTVPSTTRSSTHPSLLTSSHPSFAASSNRSSSQPALATAFPQFATGSTHPSVIGTSHFPAGSLHEYVHAPQGVREGPPSFTGSQGRPHPHSFHQSSSQQQSLRRSFSDQPGMALSERSLEELPAPPPSSLSTGVRSSGYAEYSGDAESVGISSEGQRRFSLSQLSAISGNLKERQVSSAKLSSGEQGWHRVAEESASRVGPGSAGYSSGVGSGGMMMGASGNGRDWDSGRSSDLKRAMSSGGSSQSHQERSSSSSNHAGYFSLEDLSSTSWLSSSYSAPFSHNLRPAPPPSIQHHSVVAHHNQSHATSHLHVAPPTSHHHHHQHHLVSSSHRHPPPSHQHVPLLAHPSFSQQHHPSSVSRPPMDRLPGADLQPPLSKLPPSADRRGHQQAIMLPPSMMASRVQHSSSGRVGAAPYSRKSHQNFQEGITGYPPIAYNSELPDNRQLYSSYQRPHPGSQSASMAYSGSSGSYRLQGLDSRTTSHHPFQPSLSTLESQDPSLEGESEPQGQSCFPEGETMCSYEQPMSLQMEERLSPPPPSGRGSSSAPSSLQSPNHQQQNQQQQQQQQQQLQQQKKRPEHLNLDDYLAGETQRQLTIKGSGGESKSNSSFNLESPSLEIIEHPRDATVKVLQKAVFTCKALVVTHDEGRKVVNVDLEPHLQWYKGESLLSNEVMKDLILCDVKDVDAGSYYCVVTHPHNPSHTTRSSKAQLTVKSTPSDLMTSDPSTSLVKEVKEVTIISEPPSKVTVEAGQELLLVVEIKGEEPINFKWYKDLQVLDYCHKNVLRIPSASSSDSGSYSCSITNLHSSLLTAAATIRVVQPKGKPSIVLHPLSQEVLVGQEVYLSVKVGVVPHVCSFQWYRNHVLLEAQNRPVLIIPAAKLSDTAEYYCSVTNAAGMVDSNIAFVSVTDPHAPPPLPSHSDRQFTSRPERPDELLQHYGGKYSFSQHQPFSMHGGRVEQGEEYFVNLAGGPGLKAGGGGLEYRGYQPPPNWEYRSGVIESTTDEDQPGGQGESSCPPPSSSHISSHTHSSSSSHIPPHSHSSSSSRIPPHGHSSSSSRIPPHGHSSSSSHIPPHGHTGIDDTTYLAGNPPSRTVCQPSLVDSWSERSMESSRGTRQFPFKMGNIEKLEETTSRGGTPPKIVEQPQSQKVDIGEPLSLSCRAIGQGDMSYLWYFNGLSIAAEIRPEYYINCFTDEDEGGYFCRITNPWGSIDSRMAEVSMKDDD